MPIRPWSCWWLRVGHEKASLLQKARHKREIPKREDTVDSTFEDRWWHVFGDGIGGANRGLYCVAAAVVLEHRQAI